MGNEEIGPTILISPTEPEALRSLGITSALVERKGCDALIILPDLRIGIQRKTWVDLVISLDDGRLANSIPKMDMAVRAVILEGRPLFGRDGHMVVRSNSKRASRGYATLRHTRESLSGVIFSLRYTHGLDVFRTESLAETAILIARLGKYLSKDTHRGLAANRAAANSPKQTWGVVAPEERRHHRQVNFLMGMGIGQKTAENIIKHCGGIPLQWTKTKSELMGIPLIGESTAERLARFFEE